MNPTLLRIMELGARGYTCSQILIRLALDQRDETNPALVRALAGLAYGCGNGRATCGVLTGGSCVLALCAGDREDAPSERLLSMMQELSDWFGDRVSAEYGGTACTAIVGDDGPQAARQICGALLADTHAKVMAILAANGIDPAG